MIRTLCGLALCLFTLAAQAIPAIQRWETASGARVQLVETHNLPMLDVQVDFAAGTARDPAGKPGTAAMTHALLDAGTGSGRRQLDENALADRFADLGARFGGSIDDDGASLALRVLSNASERDAALALMRDILARPNFPQRVLNRERERLLAALREARTRPGPVLSERLVRAVFGEHPYGRIADEAALRRISRVDLLDFHRRHYTARNALITLVGDLSRAEAERIADALVADLPAGTAARELPETTPPAAQTLRLPFNSSQAHIAIGTNSPARNDPDLLALAVGNYTLGGGGFNSRLMKELRDARGLTYGVSSGFGPMASGGMFGIRFETRADQAEQAATLAREVLLRFLRDGPTEAELEAAKASLVNSFVLGLDSNAKLLAQVSDIGFYRRPPDVLDTYPERVKAITLEQVRAAFARHIRPEALVTVIVGGR